MRRDRWYHSAGHRWPPLWTCQHQTRDSESHFILCGDLTQHRLRVEKSDGRVQRQMRVVSAESRKPLISLTIYISSRRWDLFATYRSSITRKSTFPGKSVSRGKERGRKVRRRRRREREPGSRLKKINAPSLGTYIKTGRRRGVNKLHHFPTLADRRAHQKRRRVAKWHA